MRRSTTSAQKASPRSDGAALAARLGRTPRSVIVVRALSGLGDMLCVVPALRALRSALPGAHVTLVAVPAGAALLRRFPRYADEVLPFPGYPGVPEGGRDVRTLPPFLAEVQARRFDLALQLHGSGAASNAFTMLLGARRTAGFFLPPLWCPDPELFVPYPSDAHEVDRPLILLAHLGARADRRDLEFPLGDEDVEALASVGGAASLRPGTYACIHPGAAEAYRRWPPERFAAVADALADRGLEPVLTGSAGERRMTAAVSSAMSHRARNVAGRTTLGALAVLLRDAAIVITNDTGTSHLAAAVGACSVVIFTGSSPRRWHPRGAAHVAVGADHVGCSQDRCLRDGCPHAPAPRFADVSPAAVVGTAEELLAGARPAAAAT